MGAKVSAETKRALRLYDQCGNIGQAARKAGIETSTLRRAIERRQASATASDVVSVLSASKDAPK